MSISEAERFAQDLADNKALLNEVVSKAAGVASVVQIANAHGYNVTVEEAKQYLESRSPKELSDEQLDAVAGGKGLPGTLTQVALTVVGSNPPSAASIVTTVVMDSPIGPNVLAVTSVVLT